MPSENKRINLTVTPELYEQILSYKAKYGCPTDTSACIQLITQRLHSLEETEQMLKVFKAIPEEELTRLSLEGINLMKTELDKQQKKEQ